MWGEHRWQKAAGGGVDEGRQEAGALAVFLVGLDHLNTQYETNVVPSQLSLMYVWDLSHYSAACARDLP